jgi:hypothetical protein
MFAEELEVFELELFGGVALQRYRSMRPEVEAMPWGSLEVGNITPDALLAARKAWTGAAFQEFRTGAACAATLHAMITARAPLDLIALASRFPLDEMVHVEMCSRLVTELGGAVELVYNPKQLIWDVPDGDALSVASHWVVSNFCVGEALSIPLIQGTCNAAKQPLIQAVLKTIVLDEADHGTFGWMFLDWANHFLTDTQREELGKTADLFIDSIVQRWTHIRQGTDFDIHQAEALGWMQSSEYLELAERSLQRNVVQPLQKRGIPISAYVAKN